MEFSRDTWRWLAEKALPRIGRGSTVGAKIETHLRHSTADPLRIPMNAETYNRVCDAVDEALRRRQRLASAAD